MAPHTTLHQGGTQPSVGCLLVAAGQGTRLGAGIPKAFVPIAGRRVVDWCLDQVRAVPEITSVVTVVPAGYNDDHMLAATGQVVVGGATRQASVQAGLAQLIAADVDVVLVQDAARCLTPVEVYQRVIDAVHAGGHAVVPVLAVPDTIRTVDGDLVDRSMLRAVQTPQGFPVATLQRAHDESEHVADADTLAATDDAALVQRLGYSVTFVDGDERAFKVTTPGDLLRADVLLR